MTVAIHHGNSRDVMASMDAESVDTIITDPPYGLGFMGKEWDHGVPGVPFWAEALRVAKPGAFMLAFGGTRTVHRLAVAIEDAGWEIRDRMCWLYGSGFPKSLDISKAIDKAAGAEREVVGTRNRQTQGWVPKGDCKSARVNTGIPHAGHDGNGGIFSEVTAPATEASETWDGYGTAMKPAWEPIIVAMKPLDGTFAHNALAHGVAGLNIDGGRLSSMGEAFGNGTAKHSNSFGGGTDVHYERGEWHATKGRWPANVLLSHHPDCVRRGVRKVKGIAPQGKQGEWADGKTSYGGLQEKGTARDYAAPDGTETVEAWDCHPECPVRMLDEQSGVSGNNQRVSKGNGDSVGSFGLSSKCKNAGPADTGGASRFFYTAKASRSEREKGLRGRIPCVTCGGLNTETHEGPNDKPQKCIRNGHPTVKPLAIMRYLARLTKTPTGGVVLDPFAGSGTTAVACILEGRDCIAIEQDESSYRVAKARVEATKQQQPQLLAV